MSVRKAGPDFLCIGAPRAGTTWLYRQLRAHPQVWVPVVKELHYFDACHPVPRVGEFAGVRRGVLGLHSAYPRRQILHAYAAALRRRSPADLRWVWRYFAGSRSDEWYCELFPVDRVSGEFTTDYSSLEDAGVAHVRRLLPDCRVIFLLRDPVKRAWSHARMVLPRLHGKALDELDEAAFEAYLRQAPARRRGDYRTTLMLWERHFPAAQLMLDFYDRISRDPEGLYTDVQRFLGITPLPGGGGELRSQVNVSAHSRFDRIPPALHRMLAELYLPDLEWLAARFGDPAERWLRDACRVLEGEVAAAREAG